MDTIDTFYPVVSATEFDNNDEPIFPDRYALNMTYNASNQIETMWFTDYNFTWTKTYTYTAGNLTHISRWIRTS